MAIQKVNKNWEAPVDIPRETASKIKASVYGSLTAVRYLITDNAPTRPSDKAKEDFTTAIKAETQKVIIKSVFPYEDLEESASEYFVYKNWTSKPDKIEINTIGKISQNPKYTFWFIGNESTFSIFPKNTTDII